MSSTGFFVCAAVLCVASGLALCLSVTSLDHVRGIDKTAAPPAPTPTAVPPTPQPASPCPNLFCPANVGSPCVEGTCLPSEGICAVSEESCIRDQQCTGNQDDVCLITAYTCNNDGRTSCNGPGASCPCFCASRDTDLCVSVAPSQAPLPTLPPPTPEPTEAPPAFEIQVIGCPGAIYMAKSGLLNINFKSTSVQDPGLPFTDFVSVTAESSNPQIAAIDEAASSDAFDTAGFYTVKVSTPGTAAGLVEIALRINDQSRFACQFEVRYSLSARPVTCVQPPQVGVSSGALAVFVTFVETDTPASDYRLVAASTNADVLAVDQMQTTQRTLPDGTYRVFAAPTGATGPVSVQVSGFGLEPGSVQCNFEY